MTSWVGSRRRPAYAPRAMAPSFATHCGDGGLSTVARELAWQAPFIVIKQWKTPFVMAEAAAQLSGRQWRSLAMLLP